MFRVEEWENLCAVDAQQMERGVFEYENAEGSRGKVQCRQPHPAHSGGPARRRGAGAGGARCRLGGRVRQPVRRCAEGHCPGAGLRHRGKCTGTGHLQIGPPVRYGHLAVYADHLSGGGHCGHHELSVSADHRSGRGCGVGSGAAGPWRGAEHPADQLCGKPHQRPAERQLHRHPVLGLPVRSGNEEIRCGEHQVFLANTADAVSQIVRWIINWPPSASWVWCIPTW